MMCMVKLKTVTGDLQDFADANRETIRNTVREEWCSNTVSLEVDSATPTKTSGIKRPRAISVPGLCIDALHGYSYDCPWRAFFCLLLERFFS